MTIAQALQTAEDGDGNLFVRVQAKGVPLFADQVSWPWGQTFAEALRADEVVDGCAACDEPSRLGTYFMRGWSNASTRPVDADAVDDDRYEVVIAQGRTEPLVGGECGECVATPRRELARITWAALAAWLNDGTEPDGDCEPSDCPTGWRDWARGQEWYK